MCLGWLRIPTSLVACSLTFTSLRGGLRDDIGWTDLAAELGPAMPTGAGVPVLQAEMCTGSAFAPDASQSAFAGKSFTFGSWGLSAQPASSHATTVAGLFYSSTAGIAPGVSTIHVQEAWCYVYESAKQRTASAPLPAPWRVENHSWIGESAMGAVELLRRLDYRAARDDVLIVSGLNNGSSTAVPTFFGHLYNGLVVGVSSGAHSRGGTLLDGVGRTKPDLVAPASATSYAAPAVAGAATLLIEAASSRPDLAAATHAEAVKALLLAGATRGEFATWSQTEDRPLDPVFGAGELNILRSHRALTAGRAEPSRTTVAAARGWDYGMTATSESAYLVDVPTGATELVIALTWHRRIQASADFTAWEATLADLDLEFWQTDAVVLAGESRSRVDNVELIVLRNPTPGRHALLVSGDTAGVSYGLAWYTEVPGVAGPPAAPGGLTLLAR